MNSLKKHLWKLGALAVVLFAASPAKAVTSQTLDIKVSISATKSLAAGTTSYDFGALAVNVASVSASAIAITNDSGSLIETYTLQGADAVSLGAGTGWELDAAPGSDQYALAAQFATARPTDADGNWGSDALTEDAATTCSTTVFGDDTNANQSGALVAPTAVRSLWFRMKTPTAVSDTTQRLAVVTIAVQ